jgi:hypothetical protein
MMLPSSKTEIHFARKYWLIPISDALSAQKGVGEKSSMIFPLPLFVNKPLNNSFEPFIQQLRPMSKKNTQHNKQKEKLFCV